MAKYVSAPLPDLSLAVGCTLTVDTLDAAAVVTSLVIHVSQDTPEAILDVLRVAPLLAYVPQA